MSFQQIIDKPIEEIFLEDKDKYKYGLIFTLNEIYLDEVGKIDYSYNSNTFIEARFFDDKKELFIFYDGEKYKAVETNKIKLDKEGIEEVIEREYILDKKFKGYSKIKIKEFIDYDDDGQAFIKASCLDQLLEGDNK